MNKELLLHIEVCTNLQEHGVAVVDRVAFTHSPDHWGWELQWGMGLKGEDSTEFFAHFHDMWRAFLAEDVLGMVRVDSPEIGCDGLVAPAPVVTPKEKMWEAMRGWKKTHQNWSPLCRTNVARWRDLRQPNVARWWY